MDDPQPVRLVQGVGDLDAVAQELLGGERALVQPLGQRLSLEVLHDEVIAVPLAADVVERADVGVGDLRDRLAPRARSAGAGLRSEVRCSGRTLTATVLSSRVSRARYTSPIPPAPIADRIS